jgi:hypothetical protein
MYYWIEPFYILEVLNLTKTEITYCYSYHGKKTPIYTSRLQYKDSGKEYFVAALHNFDVYMNDIQVG